MIWLYERDKGTNLMVMYAGNKFRQLFLFVCFWTEYVASTQCMLSPPLTFCCTSISLFSFSLSFSFPPPLFFLLVWLLLFVMYTAVFICQSLELMAYAKFMNNKSSEISENRIIQQD